MVDLITRVRGLIGDPSGASQHFTDDQIQAALDNRRREIVELPLDAVVSRDVDGDEVYLRWVADRSPWETDAVVLDADRVPVTSGVTADEMHGVWTFAASQDAVYVSGTIFDVYGASADLLDEWAIAGAASGLASGGAVVEWETDGQRVKRAGANSGAVTEERRALATNYRNLSWPTSIDFTRSDLAWS